MEKLSRERCSRRGDVFTESGIGHRAGSSAAEERGASAASSASSAASPSPRCLMAGRPRSGGAAARAPDLRRDPEEEAPSTGAAESADGAPRPGPPPGLWNRPAALRAPPRPAPPDPTLPDPRGGPGKRGAGLGRRGLRRLCAPAQTAPDRPSA